MSMVWECKWDEWFLYDDDDVLRSHVYKDPDPDRWCWLIFDLKGNVIDRGKEARTAEVARTNVKKAMMGCKI